LTYQEAKFIAIDGILKNENTALAKALATALSARTALEEDFSEPLIDFYSADPRDLAFKKQILKLIDRYSLQKELRQTEIFYEQVITDHLFYSDRIYANLKLGVEELNLYETMLDAMERDVPVPDLVIYLQSNFETIMERLNKSYGILRPGRSKQAIDEKYIHALNEEFNQFFLHYRWSPVLIINANQFHSTNPKHIDGLIQRINRPISEITYYNPPKE